MINFYAPCSNTIGYGIHSYNLIKAYSKINSDISLIPPYGKVSFQDEHVEKWLANRTNITQDDIGIMIFHEQFLNQFSGRIRIGFPVFEMERFDDVSLAAMRSCDFLFTPSEWGKETLARNGLKNIFVIPEGYDPEVYHPNYSIEYKMNRINNQGITFIHVGKFEERKGTKDIITAFSKAFGNSNEKVTLILHCQNVFDGEWARETYRILCSNGIYTTSQDVLTGKDKQIATKGNLKVITNYNQVQNAAELYHKADFGIFMSKAEGWNLPLIECLACGTPALTPVHTGMSEYLDGYPMELSIAEWEKEIANDGKWFKGDRGQWRVPDMDETVEKLRLIVKNPEEYLRKDISCFEKFTWENAAKKLDDILIE